MLDVAKRRITEAKQIAQGQHLQTVWFVTLMPHGFFSIKWKSKSTKFFLYFHLIISKIPENTRKVLSQGCCKGNLGTREDCE